MVNLKMNWGGGMNRIGNVLMQGLTPWIPFARITPVRAMSNVRPDPAGAPVRAMSNVRHDPAGTLVLDPAGTVRPDPAGST
jgi:hypothetical protein